MAKKAVLHLAGEDPILCEMAALPGPTDQFITVRNPRKRDGKSISYFTDGATSFLYPIQRVTFIEFFGDDEPESASVVTFFREDTLPKRR